MFNEALKVEKIKIKINNLPDYLIGKKLIHLSDLHYDGQSLSDDLLIETISKINQENADLILFTGDFVTEKPQAIYNLIPHLKRLKSKEGIYACLGNHDVHFYYGKKMIIDALKSINIQVLWNEIAYPFGQNFPLIGLADFWSKEFLPSLIFTRINNNNPCLVLSHNPDSAEILQQYRIDLQLSGHTHGGQVILPLIGAIPAFLFKNKHYFPKKVRKYIPYMKECSKIVKHWEWSQGLHQIGDNQLYVNRGLGSYFPGRLFCPPELTIITLNN